MWRGGVGGDDARLQCPSLSTPTTWFILVALDLALQALNTGPRDGRPGLQGDAGQRPYDRRLTPRVAIARAGQVQLQACEHC